ncbi:hypothetical protein EV421DRAFT_2039003 [Armillaria borealis]|uniref:F-box domain-containing protein n=1 Tax=Armillaria borealis TaxID=47425 RepID=A0AA39J452_9AGAR|nr:hypothetical protein EV421DRAFT_2039003 [Armillaria borealis]
MSSIPPDLPNPCPTCGSLTKTTFSDHSCSSRVSELLRCNDPPSDSELSDFQNVTKSGPGRIADLDEKITRAKEHLTSLIHERNVLEANIGDARTLSSPIRRLPFDVLRDIALATIPSRYEVMNSPVLRMDSANDLDSRESPWTLAQVSQRWRLTILNAPELWSSMSLVITHDQKPATLAHQMFMTGLRLERSKCLPLTVSISVHPEADISNHPLLLLISTRSSFLRNLHIEASLISYPAFSWWRGRLDQLYDLTLVDLTPVGSRTQSSGGTKNVIDAFEYAPQLETISLWTVNGFHSSFRFPRNQITHLDLAITDWKDADILGQLSTIMSLRIAYGRSSLPIPESRRVISLPALTSLTLAYQYRRTDPLAPLHPQSDPIFSLLSIPNVTHLWLVYCKGFNVFPTIPVPNAIRALDIEFSAGTDMLAPSLESEDKDMISKLLTLLESVTNLRDLVISSPSTTPSGSLYDVSLLILILSRIPLRHLRTLDLRGSTLRPSCMHVELIEMIRARREGNNGERAQIETVYLRYPLTLDPIYARRWQFLIDGGLEVVYGRSEP